MHVKKINQKSCYFIKRELEALFELPPAEPVAPKATVTYKKSRLSESLNQQIVVERVRNWVAVFGDADGLKAGLNHKKETLHLPK